MEKVKLRGVVVVAALALLALLATVAPGGGGNASLWQQPNAAGIEARVTTTVGTGLLVFCAFGSFADIFLTTLASIERFAPDAFVAVIADTRVEDDLKRSLAAAPTDLRVRIYRFQQLLQVSNISGAGLLVDRFIALPLLLDDFAGSIKRHPSENGVVAWESSSFSLTALSTNIAFAGMFDTGDLVFQGDPFQPLREAVMSLAPTIQGVLALPLESKHIPIGSCPFNRKWVTDGFGSEAARAVATFSICNCGALMGSIFSLRDFVKSVMSPAIAYAVAGKIGDIHYLDQGSLAFVGPAMIAAASMRSTEGGAGRLAAFTALSGPKEIVARALQFAARNKILEANAEGSWICTIGYFPAIGIEPVLDSDGYLLSLWEPGKRCRIVHQIDRYPRLNEHYTRMYARK